MPFDYEKLRATASRVIADLGRGAVLRTREGVEYPVTALIHDYAAREVDGELVLPDDRRALISAVPGGVVPNAELHRLRIDQDYLRIVAVRTIRPAGTVVYYDCQVRP